MTKLKHKRELRVDRNISPDLYIKLVNLFHAKGWDIQLEDYGIFERYVRTVGSLETDQQKKLLLDLSKQFIHITQCQYMDYIPALVSAIIKDYPNRILCYACCLPEEDIGKVKSSAGVLYQIKGTTLKTRVDLRDVKYYCKDSIKEYRPYGIANDDHLLILVDDFIGTGETALGAVDYVKKIFPEMLNSNIVVLAIAGMQQGIEELERHQIKVYSAIALKRGISDYYIEQDLENALEIMHQIEDHIKVKPQFLLGYKQSEGLISMERCPNNTFPIYWLKKNDAPYER